MFDISHLPSHHTGMIDPNLVDAQLVADFRYWKHDAISDDDPNGSTSVTIVKALLCGCNDWLPMLYLMPLLAIARLHSVAPEW